MIRGLGRRGALGGALNFAQVMRELDLGDIRRQLAEPLRILVTGTDLSKATRLAEMIFGTTGLADWSVAVRPLSEPDPTGEVADLVLITVQSSEDALELVKRYRRGPRAAATPIVAVLQDGAPLVRADDSGTSPRFQAVATALDSPDGLVRPVTEAALDVVPELGLALARRFPCFRTAVAERLIRDTSRANAQFAFVSSLPAHVPIVGGMASGAADLAVLTKNQAVLVYKLAGIFGRDLSDRVSLAIEIAPVVGGAFFWRSVARMLLGMLPTLLGGVPKAAVAYAGTYAVGQMARYYYSTGHRPPPELVERFQAEGARLATELVARLRDWRRKRPGLPPSP
jgi:uncharacterized protein (DUF697 family)